MVIKNRKKSEISSINIIAEKIKFWAAEQPDIIDAVRIFIKKLTINNGKNFQLSADIKTTNRFKLYVVHPDNYKNIIPYVKTKFANMEKRNAQKSTVGPAPIGKKKAKRLQIILL